MSALTRRTCRAGVRLVLAAFLGALGAVAVDSAARAAQAVDVVFVLDNSGSMKVNDPAFLTRRAVARFTEALAANEEIEGRIAIVLFDDKARLAQTLIPANEVVANDLLASALTALDFSGQRTNSPAGIERALYELQERGRAGARQSIVFLSDGLIDTGDAQNDLEVARWLREDLASESEAKGIRIFGIAFTDRADYQLMQALAQRTRARYYRAFEASELGNVVADVLGKVDEAPVYDLANLDAASAGVKPVDVAAAPLDGTQTPASVVDERGFSPGLLAWLPVALLLVGAGIFYQRRSRDRLAVARDLAGLSAPAASLLDFGGQLGESGQAHRLNPGRTTIGRDPKNDIVLSDDTISSEHAAIDVRDGRYWVVDLRSTNGTKLADRRLSADEPAALKGGDHIRFADVDLMFVVEGYVPGGATVYLSSSTTPPADWSILADSRDAAATSIHSGTPPVERVVRHAPLKVAASAALDPDEALDPVAAASNRDEALDPHAVPNEHAALDPLAALDPIDAPSGEVVFAEQRERLDPASILDLDDELGVAAASNTDHAPADAAKAAVAAVASAHNDARDRDAIARAEAALAALDEPLTPVRHATAEKLKTEVAVKLDLADAPTAEIKIARLVRADEGASQGGDDGTHEAENESAKPEAKSQPASLSTESLRDCLNFHLARVAEIAPAFASFVGRAFDEELRGALPVAANDLLVAARQSGQIESREYTFDRVRYLICGVPASMDSARALFVGAFGGFTRLLTEQLQAESFRADRCEILAILSFGCSAQVGDVDAPWVSLTIVPDEGQDPRIDLLSYEFLTDEERREIAPSIDPEVSQSGLA